ncbi:hypothetical protein QL285_070843 [Trifolium repens]|nr:hypothetical protein QL285_070843 [Trifolium repens]
MSLSHLLKSANRRLGLSILENQQRRISPSASYRASQVMHHPNPKIEIIENKGSSSLRSLRGRPNSQQQSCSDDAQYEKVSVLLIGLPLLASSMMLLRLSKWIETLDESYIITKIPSSRYDDEYFEKRRKRNL